MNSKKQIPFMLSSSKHERWFSTVCEFMNLQIRLQLYLFLLSVPLNLIWEVAQISAYDFPEISLMTAVIGCLVPSLGDGLMVLMIYWTGRLVFREPQWLLSPGPRGYLLIVGVGLILAVMVELNALRSEAWGYNESMSTVLGVGLLPLLQMAILPSATVLLLQWMWRN